MRTIQYYATGHSVLSAFIHCLLFLRLRQKKAPPFVCCFCFKGHAVAFIKEENISDHILKSTVISYSWVCLCAHVSVSQGLSEGYIHNSYHVLYSGRIRTQPEMLSRDCRARSKFQSRKSKSIWNL